MLAYHSDLIKGLFLFLFMDKPNISPLFLLSVCEREYTSFCVCICVSGCVCLFVEGRGQLQAASPITFHLSLRYRVSH